MNIPLAQFEQYIDEDILEKGYEYFRKGRVQHLEEVSSGVYEAVVEGADNYRVRCRIGNGIITDYSCECPSKHEPLCKYLVALILALQQDTLELTPQKRGRGRKPTPGTTKQTAPGKSPSKRMTIEAQVNELMSKIPEEELKTFVKTLAIEDSGFRQRFLSEFAFLGRHETKEYYAQQIKVILKSVADRSGYIDGRDVAYVGNAVSAMLTTAQRHATTKNYQSAMLICFAVLEEMTAALQFVDDSHADIGDNIHLAWDLLTAIAHADLSEDIRKQLFEYLVAVYRSGVFAGWDWHLGMLELASLVGEGEEEVNEIIGLLNGPHKSEFTEHEAQKLKFRILQHSRGNEVAEEFLEAHLSNPQFRHMAIESAFAQQNYARAIALAQEGVKVYERERPGLAIRCYEWLLRIATSQDDREKIIEYARVLVIKNFHDPPLHYDILKSYVATDEWNAFIDVLVQDIQKKSRWSSIQDVAWIYIKEEWWDKLRAALISQFTEQHISLDLLNLYAPYLVKDYMDDVMEIYRQGIIGEAKRTATRKHYRRLCKHLGKMKKLGAKKQVEDLIGELRKKYPQRKALMDELDGV